LPIATQKHKEYVWAMTSHVTWPCEVYISLSDYWNGWACSVTLFIL